MELNENQRIQESKPQRLILQYPYPYNPRVPQEQLIVIATVGNDRKLDQDMMYKLNIGIGI